MSTVMYFIQKLFENKTRSGDSIGISKDKDIGKPQISTESIKKNESTIITTQSKSIWFMFGKR